MSVSANSQQAKQETKGAKQPEATGEESKKKEEGQKSSEKKDGEAKSEEKAASNVKDAPSEDSKKPSTGSFVQLDKDF